MIDRDVTERKALLKLVQKRHKIILCLNVMMRNIKLEEEVSFNLKQNTKTHQKTPTLDYDQKVHECQSECFLGSSVLF